MADGKHPRPTPFDLGIPGGDFARSRFEAIRTEAAQRGAELREMASFPLLGEVGLTLRELQGEERSGETLWSFSSFLFHALHFEGAGGRVISLSPDGARSLVRPIDATSPSEERPWRSWSGGLPSPAGYLQLPERLFWGEGGPGPEEGSERESGAGIPEPVDGLFWTEGARRDLHLLLVSGIRPDRPGFSILEIPAVPLSDAPLWAEMEGREGGGDFTSTLPGGELAQLHTLRTGAEVVKLFARAMGGVEAGGPGWGS